ncbi:MAG TPA: cytochrome C biogenesis protein CcmF, partial [Acidimicrobiaceae bacterium]|nr:cytochrome C biogenesis protein CcmF [Acidimicrobiaceae bacterium]
MVAGCVIAVGAMELALLQNNFSLAYVAGNSTIETPTIYKIATLWGALEGSLLLWALLLCGYVAAAAWCFRAKINDRLVAWSLATMLAVCVFFFSLLIGPASPFDTLTSVPLDGEGLNPLLRNHPLMAIHPVMLYLGYVGFTVPFAFAVCALITGRLGEGWLVATRTWTLVAWGCLSIGILLGAWWSYEVL